MKRLDLALGAAALLLPAGAMVGATLVLLKPAPPAPAGENLPAKVFGERFAGAFADPQAAPSCCSTAKAGDDDRQPEEPAPPVPLPPVRPPPEPAPEPPPPPWTPNGAVARSPGFRMVAGNICARHGGWRVDFGRGWHCEFRHRR